MTSQVWQDALDETTFFDGLSPQLVGTPGHESLQVSYEYTPVRNSFPRERSTLTIPLNGDGIPETDYYMGRGSAGVTAAVMRGKLLNLTAIGAQPAQRLTVKAPDERREIPDGDSSNCRQLSMDEMWGPKSLIVIAYEPTSANTIQIAGYDRYNRLVGLKTDSIVIAVPGTRERPLGNRLENEALALAATPFTASADAATFVVFGTPFLILDAFLGFPKLE